MKRKFNHVSTLIREYRLKTSWSQTDLGAMLGMKTGQGQMISNIERGKCGLPPKHVYKVCKELKIRPEFLADAMANEYKEFILEEVRKAEVGNVDSI